MEASEAFAVLRVTPNPGRATQPATINPMIILMNSCRGVMVMGGMADIMNFEIVVREFEQVRVDGGNGRAGAEGGWTSSLNRCRYFVPEKQVVDER